MNNFTEICLPGSISITLPFEKATGKGEIQKGIRTKVEGFKILSRNKDIGDPDMVKVLLGPSLRKIIKEEAKLKTTIVSLQSCFNESTKAVSICEFPGLLLVKDLNFKEEG